MRYLYTNVIVGRGDTIRDPKRPALFDVITKTPKSVVYDKLISEAIIILPDQIDPDDENAINARIRAEPGKHSWKRRDEVDSWLREKLGIGVDALEARLSTVTPFRPQQEAWGTLITYRGYGLREEVDVRGLRFFVEVVKVG